MKGTTTKSYPLKHCLSDLIKAFSKSQDASRGENIGNFSFKKLKIAKYARLDFLLIKI